MFPLKGFHEERGLEVSYFQVYMRILFFFIRFARTFHLKRKERRQKGPQSAQNSLNQKYAKSPLKGCVATGSGRDLTKYSHIWREDMEALKCFSQQWDLEEEKFESPLVLFNPIWSGFSKGRGKINSWLTNVNYGCSGCWYCITG